MGVFAGFNIIRNNYFHNEEWSRGRGNRNLYLNGRDAITGHNIIEGNRFGYAARPCDDYTVGSVAMSTGHNIFRYNEIYHSNAYGFATSSYSGYSSGAHNRIYSNTIFNSGHNIYPNYEGGAEDTAVRFWSSSNTDNALKNNLYFSNNQVYTGQTGIQTFANNWDGDTQGDPLFVDASTTPPTDKTDSTLPNLDLQSKSPAINSGGALTTVAAAGSGTSLKLTDASYFQDGSWAPAGTVQADWIAVGTVGNVVQIESITGNSVTITNSIVRNDNDPVWLYKKSDGVRVLYGSAPDAGAHEYVGAQPSCSQLGGVCCSGTCSGNSQSTNDCTVCCTTGTCVPQTPNTYFQPDQYIEAEDGDLTSPMAINNDARASGGQYVYTSANNQGSVSFTFDINVPGKYRMDAMVLTPSTDPAAHDSFFIGLDGQNPQTNDYVYDTIQSGVYVWDSVSLRGSNGDYQNAEFDPIIWDLSLGLHTFTFYGREPDTRIDQIILKSVGCSADADSSGDVSMTELLNYITDWKTGSVDITDLLTAIGEWKNGC